MQFYKYGDSQGNVHIQNAVMGQMGQHHVHTPEDFEAWRKPADMITDLGGECDCGMRPGEKCDGWPKTPGPARRCRKS